MQELTNSEAQELIKALKRSKRRKTTLVPFLPARRRSSRMGDSD